MTRNRLLKKSLLTLGLVAVTGLAVVVAQEVAAYNDPAPIAQASPLHPTFALLDPEGNNVLQSNGPVSTMKTCGQCHDTAFIESHAFHADLGLSDQSEAGQTASGRAWDTSNGLFGKWDPLTYRYLTPLGDSVVDLTTADWIKFNAARLVGGGPLTTSRTGAPLTGLTPAATNVEASGIDPATGQMAGWDWTESGVAEMNCFLCHLTNPNNAARIESLESGSFGWASTATLLNTGLVTQTGTGWQWNQSAFDSNGEFTGQGLAIQDPTNDNCAQCHGVVHTDNEQPLVVTGCSLDNTQTATTGQVIAAQRINVSGVNITGKDDLTRSWDIHAERGLECTDCHFSLNNPALAAADSDNPGHLIFDPRRLELGEYLERPDHNFARGQSAQFTVAPELKGTMRRCEGCHDAASTHTWLPYSETHLSAVACESCHVPQLYAPAVQSIDWTVLQASGEPRLDCRGVEGSGESINNLVTGFKPVLMPRTDIDDNTVLAPYNLVSAWYWVAETPDGPRPVPLATLRQAWLAGDGYAPEILDTFDANGDGALDEAELIINTPAKEDLIKRRLIALGVVSPRIEGEVQPYSINHNIATDEWAVKDCQTCHEADSRVAAPIQLSPYQPGGVTPKFVSDSNTTVSGGIYSEGSALYYRPATREQGLYVFGHDRVSWIDWVGVAAVLGALGGAATHGGLRFFMSLRQPAHAVRTRKVYMYAVYERFWHWLQTFTILLLIFTGLVIHRPDMFGWLSFPHIVLLHNVLAAILVINAGLSLFYHLVSGEIRQFIPRPYGFFDQAIVQARFYLNGIFKGGPHPFEKTPQKKLNPLQQVTYFGILNVLLPLQIITGALMWGVQQWPQVAAWFGGLPFLAPFHSLVAWLFAAFIIGHVYLTTTAHEPLAGIRAMMLGWDDVEDHSHTPEETTTHDNTGSTQTTEVQPEGVAVQ